MAFSINKPVVVLLSGGIDSSTLLYYLRSHSNLIYPITISYGQRHHKEVGAAGKIAHQLGIKTHFVNLETTGVFLGSSLTDKYREVPEGAYTTENMDSTVVPNRNMVFLAIATAYAVSIQAPQVAYAAHTGDHAIYPDCRPEFIRAMEKSIKLATGVNLMAPFELFTKADIVATGLHLKVPYELTWSCYNGRKLSCGKCATCLERRAAFVWNETVDPLEYEVTP